MGGRGPLLALWFAQAGEKAFGLCRNRLRRIIRLRRNATLLGHAHQLRSLCSRQLVPPFKLSLLSVDFPFVIARKGKVPTRQSSGTVGKPTCFHVVIARRPEWGHAAIQRTLGQPDASQQTGLPRPNGLAMTAWSETDPDWIATPLRVSQ